MCGIKEFFKIINEIGTPSSFKNENCRFPLVNKNHIPKCQNNNLHKILFVNCHFIKLIKYNIISQKLTLLKYLLNICFIKNIFFKTLFF